MTFNDMKRQLQARQLDRFFIFTGDELEVQRAYINRIAETNKQTVKRIDTVAEAIKTRGKGLISNPICYVCRDDAEFQKNEEAWSKIEEMLGDNTLIYLVTKLDKRLKFYTTFEERILTFDYMTEQVLTKHIQEQLNLSAEDCKTLIHICESDYGRILNEVDKIKRCSGQASNHGDVLRHLIEDGTIYQPPTDAIFSWVDAMLSGKARSAFRLWQECIDLGEPPLKLLLVLYQGVKRLLQVQSCEVKDVSGNTGLTSWEINLVKNHVGVYRTGELVEALRNIKAIETGIKTGEIEEEFSVPFVMVSLLST